MIVTGLVRYGIMLLKFGAVYGWRAAYGTIEEQMFFMGAVDQTLC